MRVQPPTASVSGTASGGHHGDPKRTMDARTGLEGASWKAGQRNFDMVIWRRIMNGYETGLLANKASSVVPPFSPSQHRLHSSFWSSIRQIKIFLVGHTRSQIVRNHLSLFTPPGGFWSLCVTQGQPPAAAACTEHSAQRAWNMARSAYRIDAAASVRKTAWTRTRLRFILIHKILCRMAFRY
jgi:hypothetical protein